MSPINKNARAYECSAETKHSHSVEEENSRVDYEMLPGLIHCRPVALIAVKVNKLYTKALTQPHSKHQHIVYSILEEL